MRRKAQKVGKLTFVALLLSMAVGAQDFKIRAKVDLVEVPVTVKGSAEKLISGLTKDDFVILEDGRRQTITNFTVDPVPLSAAVIVDAGLSTGSLSKIQKTLGALTGAFSEFDEVEVYQFDKFVKKVVDFSHSADHLEVAMNMIKEMKADNRPEREPNPRGPFSIPGPVINGAAVVPPGQVGVITTIPAKASRVLHDAIFAAASDLGTRERKRRKIVLVVSDGETGGNDHSFDETTQSLLAKGVQVYAVGIDQPFPYKKLSVLQDYAKATGGDVYFVDSTQSIERAYSTATEEARNQYIIGYLSNNEVKGSDPVFREIAVEVAGQNRKTLHRRGYLQYP